MKNENKYRIYLDCIYIFTALLAFEQQNYNFTRHINHIKIMEKKKTKKEGPKGVGANGT